MSTTDFNPNFYAMNTALINHFTGTSDYTLDDIYTEDDFWQYFDNTLIPALYPSDNFVQRYNL
jgi:hypothetical protein